MGHTIYQNKWSWLEKRHKRKEFEKSVWAQKQRKGKKAEVKEVRDVKAEVALDI